MLTAWHLLSCCSNSATPFVSGKSVRMGKRQTFTISRIPSKSKYGNRRVFRNGQWFDSEHEADRYSQLFMLQKAGQIFDLQTQVPFELIPTQREPDTVGKRGGVKIGKCIEKACVYYADFVYIDKDGNKVVEDAKGVKTEAYKIKKKLMLYRHGIRIQEV